MLSQANIQSSARLDVDISFLYQAGGSPFTLNRELSRGRIECSAEVGAI